jgi:rubrerythrin
MRDHSIERGVRNLRRVRLVDAELDDGPRPVLSVNGGRVNACAPPSGFAPVCFRLKPELTTASSHWIEPQLKDSHAVATARLLPVLLCGEESAALVFGSLQDREEAFAFRGALEGIADDEYRHDRLLHQLRAVLPPETLEPALHSALRRYYLTLADRNMATHLARIVALDSAVCTIMGSLRKRTRPLGRDRSTAAILETIHHDEARHVRIAAQLHRRISKSSETEHVAIEARAGLIELLQFRAEAFDSLQVDPDQLFARLRRVPRTLFA